MKIFDIDYRIIYLTLSFFYRRSLVLELQATRDLLVSSLSKVQGLEVESKRLPGLQTKIKDLERNINVDKNSKG